MKANLSVLKYWRAAIADSTSGDACLTKRAMEEFKVVSFEEGKTGCLDHETVKTLFANTPSNLQQISVSYRPLHMRRRFSNAVQRGDGLPLEVAPIISEALLTRKGQIIPGATRIARDILDPLLLGAFSVGGVENLDHFLTEHPFETDPEDPKLWERYRAYCRKLMGDVAHNWPENDPGYQMLPSGLIRVATGTSAAVARILSLIDTLIEKQPDSRLLANVTRTEVRKLEATIQAPHLLADRLGHSNSDFPLADHQREVLAHLARADAGDILAVNGPPGTGKTTLLLSAIAGAWIKSALEGGDPALIVAASTNNQAVTNIIDAFGKDFGHGEGPFAGRWLPDIRSFGVFLASFTKEAEASKKYQTETFFSDIENSDYLAKASVAYILAGHVAFPALKQPTVSMIVDALRQLIQAGNRRLLQADDVHQRLSSARSEVEKRLGANPELVVQARLAAKIESEAITARTNEMLRKWEGWLAQESLLVSLFSFLPSIARKRTLRARLFLRELGVDEVVINGARIEHIDADLRAFVRSNTSRSQDAMASYAEADVALKELRKQENAWQELYASLGGKVGVVPDIIEFDRVADRKLRFPLFLLATHYWEGRWLLEMEKTLPVLQRIRKDKKGENDRDIVLSMWRRRMMLTPCAVSTFATLPGKMTCRDNITGNFQTNYLFNNIDLLIVDEAGQALPEVAGPSFALAKKAMVIGDTQQIEPITSLPSSVDIGNLVATGLLSSTDDFATLRRFDVIGLRSKTGSAMRMAQSASRFHPYQDLERGLYLFEHRRCYDDIIRYCNELCYKGTLQPKRGTAVGAAMRPMAYLHVDGIAQEAGGSRFNVLEARTIAAWLVANAAELGKRYGKSIEKTVGIITPFGRQVSEIRRACEEKASTLEKKTESPSVPCTLSRELSDRS